jgi:type IV secretory pathway TraG/TraD family ATPase VirD4
VSSAARARASGNDTAFVVLIAGVLAVCASLWVAVELGGLLTHGRAPSLGLSAVAQGIWRLLRHPSNTAAAWPRSRGVPGPAIFYLLLGAQIVVMLGVATVMIRWRLQNRPRPGWATRADIRKHLSAQAVQAKAPIIRPSITERRPDPRSVGIFLGRDAGTKQELYGSLEDSYCVVGPPRSGKGIHLVIPMTLDAPGAAVVPSTRPDTLVATADARARRGPVHVFDPQGLSDWPRPLRWAPERGCDDPLTAILRARSLTLGARAGVGVENGDFWAGMTQAVIRCYLHAAALDGRPIRQVLRWTANPADLEPVRILRTASGAAEGWGEELEEQTSADARQRGSVWAGVRRAFDSLADPRVLDACSPTLGNAFDPESFIREGGTLYLLGSTGAQLSVAPLVSAIIEDLVEHGRRLAAHSRGGRLDPPLLLVLDEAANIAPLPTLPSLLADGGGVGVPTVAVFQSLAQARARWGDTATDAMWDAATIKTILGGLAKTRDLEEICRLIGEYDEEILTTTRSAGSPSSSTTVRRAPVLSMQALRALSSGEAITLPRNAPPIRTRLIRARIDEGDNLTRPRSLPSA